MKIIIVENIICPFCGVQHTDLNEWAHKPHRLHTCLNKNCNKLFTGNTEGVSFPTYHLQAPPNNVIWKNIKGEIISPTIFEKDYQQSISHRQNTLP